MIQKTLVGRNDDGTDAFYLDVWIVSPTDTFDDFDQGDQRFYYDQADAAAFDDVTSTTVTTGVDVYPPFPGLPPPSPFISPSRPYPPPVLYPIGPTIPWWYVGVYSTPPTWAIPFTGNPPRGGPGQPVYY